MIHLSNTKNQHFISQTELRLNSINPQSNTENQRIYSFEVIDRESFSSKLTSEQGNKINKTLSFYDLFSFHVWDKNERLNFENIFTQYERQIELNTTSLLKKISLNKNDIKEEILNLYVAKYINFIRNPYSIKKVLNTFPQLQKFKPVNEPFKSNFERLLSGNRPQINYLCSTLGITNQQYVTWLGTLFMLLSEVRPNEPNFMEEVIRNTFENPKNVVSVMIYTYKNNACVVSDRGYTIPIDYDKHMAFDFNLSSNSFIRYMFGDLESLTPKGTPQKIIESYKAATKEVKVFHHEDDMNELKTYNQRTLYQCHERIFSSKIDNYGL